MVCESTAGITSGDTQTSESGDSEEEENQSEKLDQGRTKDVRAWITNHASTFLSTHFKGLGTDYESSPDFRKLRDVSKIIAISYLLGFYRTRQVSRGRKSKLGANFRILGSCCEFIGFWNLIYV